MGDEKKGVRLKADANQHEENSFINILRPGFDDATVAIPRYLLAEAKQEAAPVEKLVFQERRHEKRDPVHFPSMPEFLKPKAAPRMILGNWILPSIAACLIVLCLTNLLRGRSISFPGSSTTPSSKVVSGSSARVTHAKKFIAGGKPKTFTRKPANQLIQKKTLKKNQRHHSSQHHS